MVSKFTQPDFSAQSETVLKTNYDDAAAVFKRLAAAFAPHEQASASPQPDMTVELDAGSIYNVDSETLTEVAAQSTAALTAPSANPRKDIVHIDEATGVVGVATGAENASPTDPAIPATEVPVARINWTTSMTEITNADIDDLRPGMFSGFLKPDGDGSSLTGITTGATDAEKANILLNSFRIAINGGLSVQQMVDGVVDEYEDETGIDTATSPSETLNENYDATSDYYTSGLESLIDASGETLIGDLTGSGGLAELFNGVWGTTGAESIGDSAGPKYGGVDWGVGITKTIVKCVVKSRTNGNFQPGGANDITLVLQGSTDNFSASTVDLGTLYVGTSVQNTAYEITGLTTSTAYRYHRIKITSTGAGGSPTIAELELSEQILGNMTLVSVAATALAQPDEALIAVYQEDVDAITINTDLTAEVSRDGGVTWDLVTLAEVASLTTGRILTGTVTLTSSGTSMKYRIKTLNTKEQRIHGVALLWS